MKTIEEIKDIVHTGLTSDIIRVDDAYNLLQTLISHAEMLNDLNQGNFGELYRTLHRALTTETLLALARIYDNPSERYPTRCLKGILIFLEKNKNDLPKIVETQQLKNILRSIATENSLVDSIDNLPNEFPHLFSEFIESKLKTPEYADAILLLKQLRDKSLAHNEKFEHINRTSWLSLIKLLELAKYVVSVIGIAYFSMLYMINGEFILTRDCKRSSIALNRLLTKLNSGAIE